MFWLLIEASFLCNYFHYLIVEYDVLESQRKPQRRDAHTESSVRRKSPPCTTRIRFIIWCSTFDVWELVQRSRSAVENVEKEQLHPEKDNISFRWRIYRRIFFLFWAVSIEHVRLTMCLPTYTLAILSEIESADGKRKERLFAFYSSAKNKWSRYLQRGFRVSPIFANIDRQFISFIFCLK